MDTRARHQGNQAAWNEAAYHYEQHIERDVAFLGACGKNLIGRDQMNTAASCGGDGAA